MTSGQYNSIGDPMPFINPLHAIYMDSNAWVDGVTASDVDQHTVDGVDAVAYLWTINKNGCPAAVVFVGARKRPSFSISFNDYCERKGFLDNAFADIRKTQIADQDRLDRIKRLVAPELAHLDKLVLALGFRDKSNCADTLLHLDLIDHAELKVLIAYGAATKDVNPTIGSEIARGSLSLTARLMKTLHALCECSAVQCSAPETLN